MSLGRIERIVCPKCGGEDDFAVWLSINTMDYPEVKQKIMSGEIFLFKCPKCGSETNIKYDCLYHQMENGNARRSGIQESGIGKDSLR